MEEGGRGHSREGAYRVGISPKALNALRVANGTRKRKKTVNVWGATGAQWVRVPPPRVGVEIRNDTNSVKLCGMLTK